MLPYPTHGVNGSGLLCQGETVGQVGHLPYHFLVVHTGNDVAMTFLSEIVK